MKHVVSSFWFWILILGAFLILIAALIGGGMKEMNGWVWGLFIAGAVLAVLGMIFGMVAWFNFKPTSCYKTVDSKYTSPEYTSPDYSSTQSSAIPVSAPYVSQYRSPYSSPIGTPTRMTANIPQIQRGFTSTDLSIDSLAPQ